MKTCFTIRDANGWAVAQVGFGYGGREVKELRRSDAERIIRAVNEEKLT
jgi:hypothetical protein